MKKSLSILLLLALCLFVSGTFAENDKIVVGLIQQDLTHPFHLGEVEGAKVAAEKYGFELMVGSGDGDVARQVEVFEQFIDTCDIISINTIDVTAYTNAFAKAKEKGVKVVVQHSWSEPGMSEGTIGFDEWEMSREVGEYAIELLKAQGGEISEKNVVMLTGNLGQGLNEGRTGGFAEVMAANNVTILAQEATNWDGTQAVTIMENYLTTYGDKINLVYGLSDGVTYPATQVIINDGRGDQILSCSIDGSIDAIQAIIDGDMNCTYMLASQYTGFYKVTIPYRVMIGEYDFATSGDFILPGIIVTQDNAAAMLQMATDMEKDTQNVPFDMSLEDIIASYMNN
ncbi:MAG: sugar ABC transporter substrate-binding protein [Christensenellales bacterium]|jgi:inositol transport system substrate-binding protein|nr:sugar ABC transporter substrate-binding protein [Christensenellaceae bacterium]